MKQLVIASILVIFLGSCKDNAKNTDQKDTTVITNTDSVIIQEKDTTPFVLDSTPTSEGKWIVDTIWEKK